MTKMDFLLKKLLAVVFVWILMASMFIGVVPSLAQDATTSPDEVMKVASSLHDILIKSDYMGAYNTGIRIDNATEETLPLDENLTIGETYFIKYKVVNNGTSGPEDVYITVVVSNSTWNLEIANYSKSINSYHLGKVTLDTSGLEAGVYTITANASIPIDNDWTNNERKRDVSFEEIPTPTSTPTPTPTSSPSPTPTPTPTSTPTPTPHFYS